MPFSPIPEILEDLSAGKPIVLVDDEDRENEGDIVYAAEKVTPEAINFMVKHARGVVCLALTPEVCDRLHLHSQVEWNTASLGTAFTVTIDAHKRFGVTTGVSARDRAKTIEVAIADDAQPQDLLRPGHINPLRARDGGVLVRAGQTEGSVDLARLAGREPAAVICEIMREDGEMARMPDLVAFAAQHGLAIVKIADLIEYRLSQEILVRRAAESVLRPRVGGVRAEFKAYVYTTDVEETEYLALVLGDIRPEEPVLVRVQSASVLRDVFAAGPGDDA